MLKQKYVIITEHGYLNPFGIYDVTITRFSNGKQHSNKTYQVSEKRAIVIQRILEAFRPLVVELDGGTIKLIGMIAHSR